MKKIVLLFALSIFLASCQTTLEEGNLDLEKLNFSSFNTKKYYSKALNAKFADYNEKRKSSEKPVYFFQADADTIGADGDDANDSKPYAITYSITGVGRSNWDAAYCLAFFRNLKLDEVNAITDLKNNLLLISGTAEEVSDENLNEFKAEVTQLLGTPSLSNTSSGLSSYELTKWNLEDKKLVMVTDGELDLKNVILTESQKKHVAEIESSKHSSVTLFICKNYYYDAFKEMDTRIGFMTQFEK